ncbi:hypothetical protein TVAG_032600 [Trichomonas vaginalis G3]|uniref:Uncharacterized protein n=1 Tax=Trichomonas vaginalis (strain ATCC PRA-98 / G3) TaxID=412133 RepID=A2FIU0_TRIV3|nr:hypothetical protein TVAGG3_0487780 [Trichomonas vaginalis G3]EAX95193.1 hypothetical protein TVAG_032600 [Trichomonas vaginalis G3]KAI5516159.1 hypothetical protein TVAGG3_0487780 [Trichomonas vaginalis G3]|eukprot:XP_001308123.1 hypothetical protein [Trichomonas vaginalis G3]
MWIESDPVPFPGLTLQKLNSSWYPEVDAQEIRGVAFPRTAATEIYSTNKIQERLSQIGVETGNKSLGFWIYDGVEGDPAPKIDKCVVIMKTLGDRRLETHLLMGIEEVIKLIDDKTSKSIVDSLETVFNKHSIPIFNDNTSAIDYVHKIESNIKHRIRETIPNLDSLHLYKDDVFDSCGFIDPNEFLDIKINNFHKFVELFRIIGHECGRIISCIHRQGFLWGTYADHDFSELHCNAHPDNFVILRKVNENLLSPVDFDMSFEARCSINFWDLNKDELSTFMNMEAEFTNLLGDLCGHSALSQYGSTAIKKRERLHGNNHIILEVLRMILVYEYVQSYDLPSRKIKEIVDQGVLDVVEMALKQTENIQS